MSSAEALRLAPIVFVAGMLVHVAVLELERASGRRGVVLLNAWTAAWSCSALAFVVARGAQLLTVSSATTVAASRALYAAAVLLAALSVEGVRRLTQAPLGAPVQRAFWAGVGLVLVVTLATPWVVASEARAHVDWLGLAYGSGRPAAGAALLAPAFGLAVVDCVRSVRRSTHVVPGRRRTLLVVAFFLLATVVNDALMPLDLFPSLHLAHYGLLALALTLSHLQQGRVEGVLDDLDQAVAERTAALRHEGELLALTLADLRAAEARYRFLAQSTLEGVVLHADGKIVDSNEGLERMRAGATPRGAGVASLFDQGSAGALSEVIDGAGDRGPRELLAVRSDGAVFPVEVVARDGEHDGRRVGVLVLRDLSERKNVQARLALTDRLASLGTLAAGAAHEINNPLAYVAANLQLAIEHLDREARSEGTRELVESLRDALEGCGRIRAIVDDLRSLSRAERDESLRAVDVTAVVTSALRMAQNEIRHRARVVRETPEVPRVLASEGRLIQVLLNLLVNAAQSIPEGDARTNVIRVGARHDAASGSVVIEISDSGEGIPPDALPRIFDPFFTTKPPGAGMGLGLSICHGIVASLGGEMSVDSEVGKGTTMRVRLPVSEARAATETPPTHGAPSAERARVLVVDDEPALLRALGRVLGDHDVVLARSGREALAHCEEGAFDIILCDLMMPDITGMEVYERLLATNAPQAARMVFMTGGAFTPQAREFLAAVPSSRLDKPVDVSVLRSLIDEMAGRPRWERRPAP